MEQLKTTSRHTSVPYGHGAESVRDDTTRNNAAAVMSSTFGIDHVSSPASPQTLDDVISAATHPPTHTHINKRQVGGVVKSLWSKFQIAL